MGVTIVFVAFELFLRGMVYKKNIYTNNSSITSLILYTSVISGDIEREPHKRVKFKFYGDIGEMLYKADIKLNNMGHFSNRDYKYEDSPNEFRIVVIGGEQTASTVVNTSWPDYLEDYLNYRKAADDKRIYKVYNVAFPDAGPEQYLAYWRKHGKKFNPKVVIINLCETDYYRSYNFKIASKKHKWVHKLRGEESIGHETINYVPKYSGGEKAVTNILTFPGTKNLSHSDPWVMFGRPVAYFVSERLIDNDMALKDLQLKTAKDIVKGALPSFGGMVMRLITGKVLDVDVHNIRNFDPVSQEPAEKNEVLKCGMSTFEDLVNEIPNLVLIHNFNYPEIKQNLDYDFTNKMIENNSKIKVIDMRKRIKGGMKEDDMKSWFMVPKMSEKWTEGGHRIYAEMAGDLILEWIDKKGKTEKLNGLIKITKDGNIK